MSKNYSGKLALPEKLYDRIVKEFIKVCFKVQLHCVPPFSTCINALNNVYFCKFINNLISLKYIPIKYFIEFVIEYSSNSLYLKNNEKNFIIIFWNQNARLLI